jgi:hypothetical protein
MRNYHVILADKTERNIRATDVQVHDGVLMLLNDAEVIVVYAADAWTMLEVERKDDR